MLICVNHLDQPVLALDGTRTGPGVEEEGPSTAAAAAVVLHVEPINYSGLITCVRERRYRHAEPWSES